MVVEGSFVESHEGVAHDAELFGNHRILPSIGLPPVGADARFARSVLTTLADSTVQDDLGAGLPAELLTQVFVHIRELPGDDEEGPCHAGLTQHCRQPWGMGRRRPTSLEVASTGGAAD